MNYIFYPGVKDKSYLYGTGLFSASVLYLSFILFIKVPGIGAHDEKAENGKSKFVNPDTPQKNLKGVVLLLLYATTWWVAREERVKRFSEVEMVTTDTKCIEQNYDPTLRTKMSRGQSVIQWHELPRATAEHPPSESKLN